VTRLILVLRDLHPGRPGAVALPRLPQLERWFARGKIETATEGWRQWLLQDTRHSALGAVPPASVAAAAVPAVLIKAPVWLATPVHLIAGLDTVRVHPAGLLEFSAGEQRALAQDFVKVFAGSGWSLHATGRRELLLSGGAGEAGVRSDDPALWLGADPRAGLPSGPGAEELRRLGAEIEMWLHTHPVNEARLAQGALQANGLWIWGGGAAPVLKRGYGAPSSAGAGVAWASDLFVDGLAQLQGFTVEPLPERWPQFPPKDHSQSDVLAVCELRVVDGESLLEGLERNWITPAFEQWRAGRWQSATLLAGGRAVTLEARPFRNLWIGRRRIRPWWETLL
jgi:hypothetical protein